MNTSASDLRAEYVRAWSGTPQRYEQGMFKLAGIAQQALNDLANGKSFLQTQYDLLCTIYWTPGMDAPRELINGIQPLRQTMFEEKDPDAFRRTLELIVEAFGTPKE